MARARELRPDSAESPDVLTLGSLSLFVIRRGDRYGIRLKDRNSRLRKEFTGLRYFPVNESFRVTARFVEQARKIPILNILGQTEDTPSPGLRGIRSGRPEAAAGAGRGESQ